MTVYSGDNCPQCTLLKKMLTEKGYKYDVVTDEEELAKLNIQSIPQLKLDDGRMLSFREALAWDWM